MAVGPAVLVLPGYENSGPEHWQSVWERENPVYRRVEQSDWFHPQVTDWVETLREAIVAQRGPVVLVAHSLGCITVAHLAARYGLPVHGALLVAPADIDLADAPPLENFRPIPLQSLGFPSILVASTDDPWASIERSRLLAAAWGSRFVDIGARGHINAASALGSWPEGASLLAELIAG